MAQKKSKAKTLVEKLISKLHSVGMSERKAKELVKGLKPTVARAVSGTVTGKLEARLHKLGVTERKSKELAKVLAPLVRASIKAKVRKEAKTLDDVTDDDVNDTVAQAVDDADDPELDKVAPRVDGHRVRLDLPVVGMPGKQGIELLRVMDGLTTKATYLVSSVKSDNGIVAIRQLGSDYFNVKFYPTMAFWGKTQEDLTQLGGREFLTRQWYERCHTGTDGLTRILTQLELEAKPKSRMKALVDRFKTVTGATVIKALGYLQKSKANAA